MERFSYKDGRGLQVSKHLKDLISTERNFGLTNHRDSTVIAIYSQENISFHAYSYDLSRKRAPHLINLVNV